MKKPTQTCLMVAFHFPPCRTSSGYLRAEKFVRYLPDFGWSPQVLTANVAAYADGSIEEEPTETVHRAFAFDAQRVLSFRGKYLELLALPDRWWSWLFSAIWRGWRLFKQQGFQLIWSTYPTPTALLVGYGLKRLSGCPWVVDLRDPIIDEVHPAGRLKRSMYRYIESLAVKHSDAVVVTTAGARELYCQRYPEIGRQNIHTIGNGFDEADFEGLSLKTKQERLGKPEPRALKIVHSGTLYPLERNPLPFLNALASLKRSGRLADHAFEVVLRATGHDAWLAQQITQRALNDWVKLAPPVDYQLALQEMVEADGLIIFQADNCQAQIPAKLYEYLRSGNPIFALVDAAGDTARLLSEAGSPFQVDLLDEQAIARDWSRYIARLASGAGAGADAAWVSGLNRQHRAQELANLFDQLSES